jgi:23S rRNA (pseudouridine1915-N3)-methyltransferase
VKLCIAAVGRSRTGPEETLLQDFLKRARATAPKLGFAAIELVIVETSKAPSAEARKTEEAARLSAKIPKGAHIVALDERGKVIASEAFATLLAKRRDEGRDVALVIGGPDGLASAFGKNETLALGAMTWPHLLVRVLLAEQIYRALTILSGHPYHRA